MIPAWQYESLVSGAPKFGFNCARISGAQRDYRSAAARAREFRADPSALARQCNHPLQFRRRHTDCVE
jgi:hypothetical protein